MSPIPNNMAHNCTCTLLRTVAIISLLGDNSLHLLSLLPKSLEDTNELVRMLKEELAVRERVNQELRESKEREVAELIKIKSDLEVKSWQSDGRR